MQILSRTLKIDFMGKRRLALLLSSVLIAVSIASMLVRGMEYGIDFTGGTLIELAYPDAVDLAGVRASLAEGGFDGAVVLHFGTASDLLVRLPASEELSQAEISTRVMDLLQQDSGGELVMRRVEFVGPQVGDELREQGGLATLFALFGVLVYVWLRFEYRFALGSVAALFHDVIITLGMFSLLGLEFDLTIVAAVLAVIGYSLNDTIVVFDRIRENFRKIRKGTPVEIINTSLNQTLSRTLMTSVTTLLVLAALFVVGGELIHGFATALIIGVIVGTYSSIYVASSTTLALGISKADLMPVPKEGAVDDRP